MTAVEAYLAKVERAMRGLDPRVRADVLRELRSHLTEAAAETGEGAALEGAEDPRVLAARYRDIYGYGRGMQIVFLAIAVLLSIPTLPLLLYGEAGPAVAFALPLAALIGLIAFLFAVAVRGGSALGLLSGLAAGAARFVMLALLLAGAGAVVPDGSGWVTFGVVSLLLVVLGYLPGRARERWRSKDVTM